MRLQVQRPPQIMMPILIHTSRTHHRSLNILMMVIRAMGVGKGEDDLDLASEDSHLWVEEGREVSDAPWCDKMIV